MTPPHTPSLAGVRAFGVAAALLVGLPAATSPARPFPPILFAARRAGPDGAVPGMGPDQRTLAHGGRLLVRAPGGALQPFAPAARFFDVAHPSVSWDGRRVVFAATTSPDSGWRLWLAEACGGEPRPLTRTPAGSESGAGETRVDDLDPCWLPDDRIVFASTRYPQRAESDGGPVTQLFVIDPAVGVPWRVTTDRNGAEKPTVDPRDGRVVYARWWHARYLASDLPGGITLDRAAALPADTIDGWQVVSVSPDGDALRLAGGPPRPRGTAQAYAPLILDDGTLIALAAARPTLRPAPGATSLVAFPGGFGARRVLAGPLAGEPASVRSPASLPDGRLLWSELPASGISGSRLVASARDGRHRTTLARLDTLLALDATPLLARRRPPRASAALAPPATTRPPGTLAELLADPHTFRFDCMNVFAAGGLDDGLSDAPALTPRARLRFFAALARPAAAGGDTLVMFREAPLTAYGAVHVEDVPADVPLFEQLVDSLGHPLRAGDGPAHTASFNFARAGSGTRCIGCHAGHSALAVPRNGTSAAFADAAPSARVTASDSLAGSVGPRGAVDRRTRGAAARVGWVAGAAADPWLALHWPMTIELREVVLYDSPGGAATASGARLLDPHLELLRGGRLVKRLALIADRATGRHRVTFDPLRIDSLVVRGHRARHGATGFAEIEAFARLATP